MGKSFLIFALLILSTTLVDAEIKFLANPTWTTVLAQAKKENKIIFFDAYATWCGPCKQMDSETYTNEAVADFYNANFINVKYDMEKGEGLQLADRYYIASYPNLVFISPDGEMLHKGVGFMPASDFLTLGKTAKNPKTQYYSLKRNARQLNNADFLAFAEQAVAMQDDDFGFISQDFLASKPDILGDSSLIDLIMNYAFVLPKREDLQYFKASKLKVLEQERYNEAQFKERLISLSLQFALSEEVQVTEELDFEAVKKTLDQFVPESSFFVYNFFKTQYYLENQEIELALKAFDELLDDPEKVEYAQLSNAMMGLGETLHEAGKLEQYLAKFDRIAVPASEPQSSYVKDFVKAIIYIKTKQVDKFRATATAMLAKDDIPEEVKKDLRLALQNVGK